MDKKRVLILIDRALLRNKTQFIWDDNLMDDRLTTVQLAFLSKMNNNEKLKNTEVSVYLTNNLKRSDLWPNCFEFNKYVIDDMGWENAVPMSLDTKAYDQVHIFYKDRMFIFNTESLNSNDKNLPNIGSEIVYENIKTYCPRLVNPNKNDIYFDIDRILKFKDIIPFLECIGLIDNADKYYYLSYKEFDEPSWEQYVMLDDNNGFISFNTVEDYYCLLVNFYKRLIFNYDKLAFKCDRTWIRGLFNRILKVIDGPKLNIQDCTLSSILNILNPRQDIKIKEKELFKYSKVLAKKRMQYKVDIFSVLGLFYAMYTSKIDEITYIDISEPIIYRQSSDYFSKPWPVDNVIVPYLLLRMYPYYKVYIDISDSKADIYSRDYNIKYSTIVNRVVTKYRRISRYSMHNRYSINFVNINKDFI